MAVALCCDGATPRFVLGISRTAASKRARLGRSRLTACNASGGSDKIPSNRGLGVIGGALFGAGFILGPLLDAIHSSVELQVYGNWAINIGPLRTNLWVFPILGTFYGVVGLLHLALDEQFARNRPIRPPSFEKLALCFVYLVFYLELSAQLYRANVPYNIEAYILFAGAQLNWALFEGTVHGFALASLVGVLCPALEIPIIKWFHLWHYSNPNIFIFDEGVVTWVICCYFAYTPFLSNLSRWLKANITAPSTEKE
ncbi:uncharacterized protein LOC9646673 [Selaginella moellendorffii]|nr:uncharacterized protein LOC9646673 [Selaginella moellendorffii]|eukprot:XP_002969616.2 uncharacterized protein LOC9646673 [Selaginella moellendorffii]